MDSRIDPYQDHVIAYNICTIMYDDIYVLYYICICWDSVSYFDLPKSAVHTRRDNTRPHSLGLN